MNNKLTNFLKTIVIFVVVLWLIPQAYIWIQPHSDMQLDSQKMISSERAIDKPFTPENLKIEIALIQNNKLTLNVINDTNNPNAFYYDYNMFTVKREGNKVRADKIAKNNYIDINKKNFAVKANDTTDVIIDCTPITQLVPGEYILNVSGMYLDFVISELPEDTGFFSSLFK